MKKLLLLLLLIPNLLMAELKPLSFSLEDSPAMMVYKAQRCSAFFLASEWLFEISNKPEIAKAMNGKATMLESLAYSAAKNSKAKIRPDINADGVMRIYDLYINDMQSSKAVSGNYMDGVAGNDAASCNSLYDSVELALNR